MEIHHYIDAKRATRKEFEEYQILAYWVSGNSYTQTSRLPGIMVIRALNPFSVTVRPQ